MSLRKLSKGSTHMLLEVHHLCTFLLEMVTLKPLPTVGGQPMVLTSALQVLHLVPV